MTSRIVEIKRSGDLFQLIQDRNLNFILIWSGEYIFFSETAQHVKLIYLDITCYMFRLDYYFEGNSCLADEDW